MTAIVSTTWYFIIYFQGKMRPYLIILLYATGPLAVLQSIVGFVFYYNYFSCCNLDTSNCEGSSLFEHRFENMLVLGVTLGLGCVFSLGLIVILAAYVYEHFMNDDHEDQRGFSKAIYHYFHN